MATSDVAAAGTFLLEMLSGIQSLGNNYYKSTDSWNNFPGQVLLLQGKHSSLQASLQRHGLLDNLNPLGLELLEHATQLMQEQKNLLDKRSEKGKCSILKIIAYGRRAKAMIFPEQVGMALGNAIKAYDAIEAYLRSQMEIEKLVMEVNINRPSSPHFHQSSNYVQLGCEPTVSLALTKSRETSSPTVVLLHGGPGRGKSTLVRQISAKYHKEKTDFIQVCLLECGPEASVEAAEIELLQRLGLDDSSDVFQMQLNSGSIPRQKRLQNLLKNPKLLVVFDDIWEPKFLQNFLNLSASGVKFLVTSRRRDLLSRLDCTPDSTESIEITNLQLDSDAAKQMLMTQWAFN